MADDDKVNKAIGGSVSLEDRFGYHRATAETAPQHAEIRQLFYDLAVAVSEIIPPGRDASLCLTEIQSAMHWANSAVAMGTPVNTEPARA